MKRVLGAAAPAALGFAAAFAPTRAAREHVRTDAIVARASADRVDAPVAGDVPYGDPVSQSGAVKWTMLKRDGFRIAYDERRLNPAWVTYTYTYSSSLHKNHKRLPFTTDEETTAQITTDDYTGSGYSRGHMAPSFGIFTYFGKDAQKQAYKMSNICPQKQAMNAGPWEDAEDRSANKWAKRYGRIWTIDGPCYPSKAKTISTRKIHVPDATFKIVVRYDEQARQPRVMAFLMPQKAAQRDPAVDYLASVDEIEERSGLDFFADLPDDLEESLESVREQHLWPQ